MPTRELPPGDAFGSKDNPLPVGKTLHHNLSPVVGGIMGYGFSCSCGRPHHMLDLLAREDWANYNLFAWEQAVERYQSLPFFGMCRVEMAHIFQMLSETERRRKKLERLSVVMDSIEELVSSARRGGGKGY